MSDVTIDETKAELRRKAQAQRAALFAKNGPEASAAAVAHFLREIDLAPTDMVAAFWPIRDEIDIKPALARLMDSGQPVCLPVVVGKDQPLEWRQWLDGAALTPAGFGTLAPDELAPVVVPDVILMPMLGFDTHGTRLGYGGGYYDRTLQSIAKRPRLIGFAFSVQAFDFIPREPHDVPLDAVVTEDGVTLFGTFA
jgi:5-formyltetrahydrofolate cyclo-ligase